MAKTTAKTKQAPAKQETAEQFDPSSLATTSSTPPPEPAAEEPAPEMQTSPQRIVLDRLCMSFGREELTVHNGYCGRHLNCQMTARQAAAAKMAAELLSSRGKRFEGGRSSHPAGTPVDNANDVVRWLLDQLADDLEVATNKSLVHDFDLKF